MILCMNKFARQLGILLVTLWLSTPVLAALPEKPPAITNPPKPYAAYAIALVLIAGVCVAVFKSSKRTHLD